MLSSHLSMTRAELRLQIYEKYLILCKFRIRFFININKSIKCIFDFNRVFPR